MVEQSRSLDFEQSGSLSTTVLKIEQTLAQTPRSQINNADLLSLIKEDPQFQELEHTVTKSPKTGLQTAQTNLYTQMWQGSYQQFLCSNAPLSARLFVVGDEFQGYVKGLVQQAAPGPYFYRTLNGLFMTGDSEVISTINHSMDNLTKLDMWHFMFEMVSSADRNSNDSDRYSGYKRALANLNPIWLEVAKGLDRLGGEALSRKYKEFNQAANSLFDLCFDTNNHSQFRQYILQNFASVLEAAMPDKEDITLEYYSPILQYQRIKSLFQTIPEGRGTF